MILTTRSFVRWWTPLPLLMVCGFALQSHAEIPTAAGKMPEDSIPALKAILESATKQSPTILSRNIQIEQSELDIVGARASMLPNIGGSYSFASTTVYPKEGDSNRSQGPYYNVGVSQPIYQWNALKNQVEISRIGLKISQKNYAEAYRGLLNSLRLQFLGLIGKKNLIRAQQFSLKLTEKYLALDEERLRAGALSPVQLIIPRMNTIDAQLGMARTEEDYEHSKRGLARLAGVDSIPEDSIPLDVPAWAGSTELVASMTALLQRDGVDITTQGQLNTLSLKRAQLTYDIAKVRLYPKVSASGGVSQSNSQTVTDISATQSSSRSYNYGIVASWTLFDGFAARSAKLSALATKRGLELERAQMQASLQEDLRSLSRQLEFSVRALALTEQRRSGLAQSLERIKEDLANKHASPQQVDTAVYQLYAYDGTVASARADVLSRWLDLVSLLNLDPMLEKLPPAYAH